MVKISLESRSLMHTGLQATSLAIASYASACRSLQADRPDDAQLELCARRLEAMRRDLDRRLGSDAQDVLFIALNVLEAGLASLAASAHQMRQAYMATQPRDAPPQGWFTDESTDASMAA